MPTGSPENIIDYRERINSLLDISVPISKNDSTNLNAAMRYSVINGGKRIRPLLIYTSGFCFNSSGSLTNSSVPTKRSTSGKPFAN